MSDTAFRSRLWFWAALALTAAKLWLTDAQPITGMGHFVHDDALFLSLGESILHGNWLGAYNNLTLAKGPFFPLMIAATRVVGIPLFLAQQLLYAGACAALVRACRPAITSAAARFAFYALLLCNPASFDTANLSRVLRQHSYASLGLMLFAGLVALYFRRRENAARQLPWALLLGSSFSAFYLTREDTLWITPSFILLAGAILFMAGRDSRAMLARSSALLATAACCALPPILGVCALNAHYYGWFGTVEFRDSAFNDAYGALVRVRVDPEIPDVPVTRQSREAIYAISPTFSQLRPHLDGDIGRNWASCSAHVTGLPNEERQIGGGWFMWALRDAVTAAGHGHNYAEAHAFYRAMADEINTACDAGRLPCGPRRSGFLPRWQEGQKTAVLRALPRFADYVVSFRNFSAHSPPSVGTPGSLALFQRMTGGRLAPTLDDPDPMPPLPLSEFRIRTLQKAGKFLRHFLFWLFIAAQICALVRVAQCVARRQCTYPLALAAAAWGGALAYLAILAVIHVTSFPVLAIAYCASAYPLVLLFIAATAWDACTAWKPGPRPEAAE